MTNQDKILDMLRKMDSEMGICDDCLAWISGVNPRNQVNQICRRLETQGLLRRKRGDCDIDDHQREKELNFLLLVNEVPAPEISCTTRNSNALSLAEQTDRLSQWLFDASRFLDHLGSKIEDQEPFAARVARMKRERKISPQLSSVMQMLNTFRVQVVKERSPVSPDEWQLITISIGKCRADWKNLGFPSAQN